VSRRCLFRGANVPAGYDCIIRAKSCELFSKARVIDRQPTARTAGRRVLIFAEIVAPLRPIVSTGLHAAFLETASVNRRDRGHFVRAFRLIRLRPRTIRYPRFTRVSDGKPFLRFEERSKGGLVEGIAMT
jgi:hypothetical protein